LVWKFASAVCLAKSVASDPTLEMSPIWFVNLSSELLWLGVGFGYVVPPPTLLDARVAAS